MTDLGCKVKNCVYHSEENLCTRNNIKVDGSYATDCCDTHCGSYEDGTGSAKNSCGCGKKKIEITCEAVNCKYNENNNCTASHIDVKPSKVKSNGYTECASFMMK